MDRIIKILFSFLFLISLGFSQRLEITALGGYQFGGIVDETTQEEGVFTPGEALGLSGNGIFGLIVDYRLGPRLLLELSWDRQPTWLNHHVPTDKGTEVNQISDINVDYYQIGLIYDWSASNFKPFAGATIGVVSMNPTEIKYSTETQPSFTVLLGMRYFLNEIFALRLQGKLHLNKIPKGNLFFPEYQHNKETFMSQFQIGLGIVFAIH